LLVDKINVGHISTAIWSPRLECNVALGMLKKGYWDEGQSVVVKLNDGTQRAGKVVALPFGQRNSPV